MTLDQLMFFAFAAVVGLAQADPVPEQQTTTTTILIPSSGIEKETENEVLPSDVETAVDEIVPELNRERRSAGHLFYGQARFVPNLVPPRGTNRFQTSNFIRHQPLPSDGIAVLLPGENPIIDGDSSAIFRPEIPSIGDEEFYRQRFRDFIENGAGDDDAPQGDIYQADTGDIGTVFERRQFFIIKPNDDEYVESIIPVQVSIPKLDQIIIDDELDSREQLGMS